MRWPSTAHDHLVIYGQSQGTGVANVEKQRLAEQYPAGTTAPDIDFVLGGDPNLPNGGLAARFPGLYIPILNLTLNGPAATDTQFETVEINRQYDGFADFPLYPLNLVADLNAVLGIVYVHMYGFDVSLPADPTTSPAYQGTHHDTSYYFFETQDLPLFGPLRTLGVPEPVIDVFEPFFRVIVERGYDRSIAPWEPTPARLIPTLNPGKVTTDVVNAIGEGINNALALVGLAPLLSIPAPVTLAAPATETAKADMSRQTTSSSTPTQTQQVTADGSGDPNPAVDVDRHGARTQQVSLAPAGASESPTTATPKPSASASPPRSAKPAGQPVKPRPVVRDSLGVGHQLRDRSHHDEGDHSTPRTAAAGAEKAATGAGSSAASSSAASSSTGSSSSGDGASGGDGHGS